jgi:hypothetical protein
MPTRKRPNAQATQVFENPLDSNAESEDLEAGERRSSPGPARSSPGSSSPWHGHRSGSPTLSGVGSGIFEVGSGVTQGGINAAGLLSGVMTDAGTGLAHQGLDGAEKLFNVGTELASGGMDMGMVLAHKVKADKVAALVAGEGTVLGQGLKGVGALAGEIGHGLGMTTKRLDDSNGDDGGDAADFAPHHLEVKANAMAHRILKMLDYHDSRTLHHDDLKNGIRTLERFWAEVEEYYPRKDLPHEKQERNEHSRTQDLLHLLLPLALALAANDGDKLPVSDNFVTRCRRLLSEDPNAIGNHRDASLQEAINLNAHRLSDLNYPLAVHSVAELERKDGKTPTNSLPQESRPNALGDAQLTRVPRAARADDRASALEKFEAGQRAVTAAAKVFSFALYTLGYDTKGMLRSDTQGVELDADMEATWTRLLRREDEEETLLEEADAQQPETLTLAQLRQLFLLLGHDESSLSYSVKAVFADMDTDHDGRIDCAEFKAWLQNYDERFAQALGEACEMLDEAHIFARYCGDHVLREEISAEIKMVQCIQNSYGDTGSDASKTFEKYQSESEGKIARREDTSNGKDVWNMYLDVFGMIPLEGSGMPMLKTGKDEDPFVALAEFTEWFESPACKLCRVSESVYKYGQTQMSPDVTMTATTAKSRLKAAVDVINIANGLGRKSAAPELQGYLWKRAHHPPHRFKRRYFVLTRYHLEYYSEAEDYHQNQKPKQQINIVGLAVTASYSEADRHGTKFVFEIGHSRKQDEPSSPTSPNTPVATRNHNPDELEGNFILAHDTADGKAHWVRSMFPNLTGIQPNYGNACAAFRLAINLDEGIPKAQRRRRGLRRRVYEKVGMEARFHRDYVCLCKLLADPYLDYCVLPQCESWMYLYNIFDLRTQGTVRLSQVRQGLETCCTPDIGVMDNSAMVARVMLSVNFETLMASLHGGVTTLAEAFKAMLVENSDAVAWCKVGGDLKNGSVAQTLNAFNVFAVRQLVVEKQFHQLGELCKSTRNVLALERHLYRMRHSMQEFIAQLQKKLRSETHGRNQYKPPLVESLRRYINDLKSRIVVVSGHILEDMARLVDEFNAECLRSHMNLGESLEPFGSHERLNAWMRSEHPQLVRLIQKFLLRRWQKLVARVGNWENQRTTKSKSKAFQTGLHDMKEHKKKKKRSHVSKRPGELQPALARLQARARGTMTRNKARRSNGSAADGISQTKEYHRIDFSKQDVGSIDRFSWFAVLNRYLHVMQVDREEVKKSAKAIYAQEHNARREIRQGVRSKDGETRVKTERQRSLRDSLVVNAAGDASFPSSLITWHSEREGKHLSHKLGLLRDKLNSWNELMSASHWLQ